MWKSRDATKLGQLLRRFFPNPETSQKLLHKSAVWFIRLRLFFVLETAGIEVFWGTQRSEKVTERKLPEMFAFLSFVLKFATKIAPNLARIFEGLAVSSQDNLTSFSFFDASVFFCKSFVRPVDLPRTHEAPDRKVPEV